MPVFPLVESSRALPGANFPLRLPSAMILAAARSLTDPPGLNHSAFPNNSTPGRSWTIRSKRSSGVFPTRSYVFCPNCGEVEPDRTDTVASSIFWDSRSMRLESIIVTIVMFLTIQLQRQELAVSIKEHTGYTLDAAHLFANFASNQATLEKVDRKWRRK